jgi:long-chain acyl-CoA synthetase
VPAEIDLDEFASINDIFDSAVQKYRDKTAFISMGKSITYGELERLSRDFAGYLLGELKLKKGDRVAIMMPNCLQYPVAILGVLRAGLTVVNTNPMYTARELKHQLVDSGASDAGGDGQLRQRAGRSWYRFPVCARSPPASATCSASRRA